MALKISTSGGGAAYSSPAVANPLTARMHKGINTTADEGQTPIIQHGGGFDDVAHSLRAEGFDASEDGTGRGTPIVPIALQDTRGMDKAQNGKGWSDDGTSYTVDALATQGVVQPVAFTAKDHGGDAIEGISPTLREGGAMPEGPHDTANIRAASGGSSRSYDASQAWGVRRLTPREAERLQGFPDDFTAIPWRGKPASECPDGPRYRCLGNSMAVNVMCFIGERIEAVRAAELKGVGNG